MSLADICDYAFHDPSKAVAVMKIPVLPERRYHTFLIKIQIRSRLSHGFIALMSLRAAGNCQRIAFASLHDGA